MGCLFSKCTRSDKSKIKVIDLTPPSAEFDHLRASDTITFSVDEKYNIPILEIDFEGWYEISMCLWPYQNEHRENFLQLQGAPSISCNDSVLLNLR